MKFRHDINGLRAIAVIVVVLFHFNVDWLPGGFVGVDIFFVISGFLMTSIITRGLQQDHFSLLSFYAARLDRIVPALAFLCAFLLVLGYFLIPLDYAVLGRHIASSMSFISNFSYLKESGYFDSASNEKWLLHTWSLAVEWQFYVIYPLALMLLYRFLSHNQVRWILVGCTFIGFALGVFGSYNHANAAYFLLPFRGWEMLLGGVAALFPLRLSKGTSRAVEYGGFFLIIVACFCVSSHSTWPGYLALLPTIGTYLMIVAHRNNSFLTHNFVLQKLGAWSYSLYLWHWPLVVAPLYFSIPIEKQYWWLVGIPLSCFCAWFSYQYIESQTFFRPKKWRDLWRSKPLMMIFLMTGVGLYVELTFGLSSGWPKRFSPEFIQQNKSAFEANGDWAFPMNMRERVHDVDVVFIQGASDKNVLMLGASHIQQTYPYAQQFHGDFNVYYLTESACMPLESFVNPHWSCDNLQNYKKLFDALAFDTVVVSLYLIDWYLPTTQPERKAVLAKRIDDLSALLQDLKQEATHVYLVLGEPQGQAFDPIQHVRRGLPDKVPVSLIREQYTIHSKVLNELYTLDGVLDNVHIIDPIAVLCDEYCSVFNDKKEYHYKDKDHMRPHYAKEALKYLDPIWR